MEHSENANPKETMNINIAQLAGGQHYKPTKAQVAAAAMATARLDETGWRRLTQSQRDDYLIDAHAALVAAHRAKITPRVTVASEVVYMSREHADLYASLFRVCERIANLKPGDDLGALVTEEAGILDKLRALASPERTTP